MDYKPLIALALLFPACAWADNARRPPPRAGLWAGTAKHGDSDSAAETRYCIDATAKQKLPGASLDDWTKKHGTKIKVTVDGNTVHAVAVVKMAELGKHTIMTTEITLTYSGDAKETTGITDVIHTSLDPPSSEGSDDTTIEEHWAGACPTDMKPGDMIVNGRKIDITKKAK